MEEKIREMEEYINQMASMENYTQNLSPEVLQELKDSDMSIEVLRQTIEKERNNLKEFTAKYNDLDKMIYEYEEEKVQIIKVKERMDYLDNALKQHLS